MKTELTIEEKDCLKCIKKLKILAFETSCSECDEEIYTERIEDIYNELKDDLIAKIGRRILEEYEENQK